MNQISTELFCGILAGMMVLSGCAAIREKYQTHTLEVMPSATITPTVARTPTPEATATEEKIYGGKELVEQLVFEREIPTLSQVEMADIVANAHRFKDDYGHTYSLGYFPMERGYIGLQGILIDLEKSSSMVNGYEIWRLLMITELKKTGGFESTDEKKYIIVPVYFTNDIDKVGFRANLSSSSDSFIEVDTLVSILNEQQAKYGNIQLIAYTFTYFREDQVEEYKTMSNWPDIYKGVLSVYNGSDEAKKFEEYVIKHDYEGTVDFIKDGQPFLSTISVTISSD